MTVHVKTMNDTAAASEAALWMPFAVGLYFACRVAAVLFFVDVLGMEARQGAECGVALNFAFLILVCFHSLRGMTGAAAWMLRITSVRWVFVFLGFSCCSLAWTISVSPASSAAYWCGVAADAAMVLVLLSEGNIALVSQSLMKGYVYGACCLAITAWLMPAQPDLRLGDPDYFNTNQIASACAFAIFLAQYLMSRRDGNWKLPVLFLVVTLIRTLSKTTIVAFLLSEAFLLLRSRSMSRGTKTLMVVGALVMLLLFWGLFSAYYEVYTNAGNQAETLTGRTAIWAFALEGALQKPWFGNGFDAMWKVMPAFGPDQFQARHAENEILQQFYAYGVVGVLILVGLYSSLWREIRRMRDQTARLALLALLLFIVIRGLAEAEPFDLLLPLWSIVMFSAIAVCGRDYGDGESREMARSQRHWHRSFQRTCRE